MQGNWLQKGRGSTLVLGFRLSDTQPVMGRSISIYWLMFHHVAPFGLTMNLQVDAQVGSCGGGVGTARFSAYIAAFLHAA